VLKKRTGPHQAEIRDFQVDTDGIRLGKPLRHIQGVLTGNVSTMHSGDPE
jgi:circadian clock protein KaiC